MSFGLGVNVWNLYQDMVVLNVSWEGCVVVCFVFYDIMDVLLICGNFEMFWVFYLVLDELDNGEFGVILFYLNSYFDDVIIVFVDECQ